MQHAGSPLLFGSQDEREVLYSQVHHLSSELMLVENFR